MRRVLDSVEAGTNPQRGLGLVGPVGCGKTSLLVTAYKLVAPRLLEHPAVPASTIQFVSVVDMVDLWRSSFDEDRRTGEPRYAQLSRRAALARLLVLDESSRRAADRVDKRSGRTRSSIIGRATSCRPGLRRIARAEELEQLITPRCYSRLDNPADVLEVTGPDLRRLCR